MLIVSASHILFADNSIKANMDKFQGVIRTGSRNNTDIHVSLRDVDIAFVQKIDVLDVYIDGKLNFNEHVHRICTKTSSQIHSWRTPFHLMYENSTLCTKLFISSKCHWSIYRTPRKRRGTFRIVHKVGRSSPTVRYLLYNV